MLQSIFVTIYFPYNELDKNVGDEILILIKLAYAALPC